MRKKAAAAMEQAADQTPSVEAAAVPAVSRSSQTWAMLIKRVYEADPLACPLCSSEMKVECRVGRAKRAPPNELTHDGGAR
ncbi:MAG: hypothetical protein U9N87_05745, partial [Planctomycetota bacterium]|nr:hypothetical protein [Planctomycetota bacterium]